MREGEEGARDDRARNHAVRAAILTLLEEDDELTPSEICAGLVEGSVSRRDLFYHLRVLKACRLIDQEGDAYRLA